MVLTEFKRGKLLWWQENQLNNFNDVNNKFSVHACVEHGANNVLVARSARNAANDLANM